MLISTGFLVLLTYTLYNVSIVKAWVALNNSILEGEEENKSKSITGSDGLRCDGLENAIQKIDISVQSLQEKTQAWAIFRHHIEAWNTQTQALEQKLELLKRTQDEQHTHVSNKLTSLEFSLNHVLSKVVYLSDSCTSYGNSSSNPSAMYPKPYSGTLEQPELFKLLADIQRANNADRKLKNEISTRLSNILRYVQSERTRATVTFPSSEADAIYAANSKMANLMLPAGSACNMEQTLKALERRMNTLSANLLPQKEFKQMQSLAKKNAKVLESILNAITDTNKRLEDGLTDMRSMAGELSTFTESSDLLLKRIEEITSRLVQDVREKLNPNSRNCRVEDAEIGLHGTVEGNQENIDVDGETDEDDHNDEDDQDNQISKATGESEENTYEEPAVDNNDHEYETDVNNSGEVEFMQPLKTACHQLQEPRVDGIYKFASPLINIAERDFNERFCIFPTDGAAWTVIQNRGSYDEQESFNRSWADYRNGFGSLDKDFWFGNEFIHELTYRDDYALRVELEDFEGQKMWAEYAVFRLDSDRYNYNLLLGGYRGSVPDSLMYHNDLDFSTYDRRNDKSIDACCACATGYASGWWFNNCSEANLNGVYHNSPTGHNYVGIIWENWRGDYSLKKARMMIRSKNWLADRSGEGREEHSDFTEDP